MNQPTPNITQEDVKRIARRDYGSAADDALAALARYGAESYHRERERVQVAVLKLARGKLDELRRMTCIACDDYRDVLSWAEYPEYSKISMRDLPAEEKTRIIAADSKQYSKWMKK